jgi:hypothetical protein
MMSYLIYDAMRAPGRSLTAAEFFPALLFGAAWFGVVSVVLGGTSGAILGAVVGTFLPVRRHRGPERVRRQDRESRLAGGRDGPCDSR